MKRRWINWLNRLTGPIRREGVEKAMKESEDEAEKAEAHGELMSRQKRRGVVDVNEDNEVVDGDNEVDDLQ